jgi:hypothetical protein
MYDESTGFSAYKLRKKATCPEISRKFEILANKIDILQFNFLKSF